MQRCENSVVPSGDTDIIVLTVSILYEYRHRILLDNACGKHRKLVQLSDIDMDKDLVGAPIGFHSFTVFVSSLFGKGKEKCWKLVEKTCKFQRALKQFGDSWTVPDDIHAMLEEYVNSTVITVRLLTRSVTTYKRRSTRKKTKS